MLPKSPSSFGHGLREFWSLDPTVTFLNHGSYGATPRYVQAVQTQWRGQMEAGKLKVPGSNLCAGTVPFIVSPTP